MPDNSPALVVVAAGGLGTRVHPWSQFIPKEFYPVDGRPGLLCLLAEIALLGPARVAVVYHPYYKQFAAWAAQVLGRGDHARYADAAAIPVPPPVPEGMTVEFIPQHGPYGDITSVLNGADNLAAESCLYVAFADCLYPGARPLELLRDTADNDATVLASAYRRELAPTRGILITSPAPDGEPQQVRSLVEKPDPAQARALEDMHGTTNLLMLEGRARLTAPFIQFARDRLHTAPGNEPKLALALSAFAREHQVVAVPTKADVIDLGSPPVPAALDRSRCWRRQTSRCATWFLSATRRSGQRPDLPQDLDAARPGR
jgi:UTP-glucose-1-phosphate uridylyltransferase